MARYLETSFLKGKLYRVRRFDATCCEVLVNFFKQYKQKSTVVSFTQTYYWRLTFKKSEEKYNN